MSCSFVKRCQILLLLGMRITGPEACTFSFRIMSRGLCAGRGKHDIVVALTVHTCCLQRWLMGRAGHWISFRVWFLGDKRSAVVRKMPIEVSDLPTTSFQPRS